MFLHFYMHFEGGIWGVYKISYITLRSNLRGRCWGTKAGSKWKFGLGLLNTIAD